MDALTISEQTSRLSESDLIRAFAEAKNKEKQIKSILSQLTAELYLRAQKDNRDYFGNKELGKATIVYKNEWVYAPEIMSHLDIYEEQISILKKDKSNLEKEAQDLGKATAEKRFAYVKYTPAKK